MLWGTKGYQLEKRRGRKTWELIDLKTEADKKNKQIFVECIAMRTSCLFLIRERGRDRRETGEREKERERGERERKSERGEREKERVREER